MDSCPGCPWKNRRFPRLALPKLREKLLASHMDPERGALAEELLSLESGDQTAQDALIDLASGDSFEPEFIQAFGRAGPAAKRALPMLREKLKSPYRGIREDAADAIKQIEGRDGSH